MSRECEYCQSEMSNSRNKRFCNRSCSAKWSVRNNPKFALKVLNPTLNHSAFKDITLESAYWAGFLAGDGCILDSKWGDPQVSLELASKDRDHLVKFSEFLSSSAMISHRSTKKTGQTFKRDSYDTDYMKVSSRSIVDDLKKFEVKQRKTLTLTFPELEEPFSMAYIAGYIDADGCYTTSSSKNRPRPVLKVLGTESFLSDMSSVLGEPANVRLKDHGKVFVIQWSGDPAIRVRNKYIDMPLPFLDRKYRLWESLNLDMEILK